jgi:hypothetical protein
MSPSHQQQIAQVLKTKPGLIAAAEHVGRAASDFFKAHIASSGISKAQLAALGTQLRRAQTLPEAINESCSFLDRQMKKLAKREENGAKPSSWRKPSVDGNAKKPVGGIVIDWFSNKRYLPNGVPPSLQLLQHFWHQIETLYHYSAVTHKKADIKKEICS